MAREVFGGSSELDNMTWHEVQRRVLEVQKDQQMCIHKQELTELDIYNRILRYKNYMVALVNKDVLPLHFTLPLLGPVVYLTQGLKYNLELILFWFRLSSLFPAAVPPEVSADDFVEADCNVQAVASLADEEIVAAVAGTKDAQADSSNGDEDRPDEAATTRAYFAAEVAAVFGSICRFCGDME
ncbi:hypothetical protein HPB52_010228 [Rhipicephalus sanguineus]|uniref:Autophagy-related protein 9 n=1 Tax=Rhipicephalus sanguineus TaxID=34632 RepID=A0A9D4SYQ7_RHISA|nr:hypothetical protein HPB52_010228 [Rhipicephalus sanguineus]